VTAGGVTGHNLGPCTRPVCTAQSQARSRKLLAVVGPAWALAPSPHVPRTRVGGRPWTRGVGPPLPAGLSVLEGRSAAVQCDEGSITLLRVPADEREICHVQPRVASPFDTLPALPGISLTHPPALRTQLHLKGLTDSALCSEGGV